MTARAFTFGTGFLVVLLALSATPFPGAMIGFFCGIAIAFFAVPCALLLASILTGAGLPIAYVDAIAVCAGLYALLTLVTILHALAVRRGEDPDKARLATFRAILLVAMPAIAYISCQSLAAAWP